MKPPRKRRLLLVLLPALAFAATLALPASAHTPAVYLEGAEQWTESDCEGETPIVVASDSRAQSNIYAAVMLAGVLETDWLFVFCWDEGRVEGPRVGVEALLGSVFVDAEPGGPR